MARILPVVDNCISNQELIDELNEAMKYKICFLKSPAGYGKTTLLGKWLEDKRFENIYWYSFKKIESLPSLFFRSFFGGLKSKLKNVNIDSLYQRYREALITAEEMANLAYCLDSDLEMIFVLDDFQNLSHEVYNLLKVFIENTGYKCQFVIASREDIPLEFSEFIIKNQICFINKALSFNYLETKRFFESRNIFFDDETINQIIDYTNGWVPAYVSISTIYKTKDLKENHYLDYLYGYIKKSIIENLDSNAKSVLRVAAVLETFSKETMSKILNLSKEETKKAIDSCESFFIRCSEYSYRLVPLIKDYIINDTDKRAYTNTCKMVAKYFDKKCKYDASIELFCRVGDYVALEESLYKYSKEHNYKNYSEISNVLQSIPIDVLIKKPIMLFSSIIDSFNRFDLRMVSFYYDKLTLLIKLDEDKKYKNLNKALLYLSLFNNKISNNFILRYINKYKNNPGIISVDIDLCSFFPSILRGLRDFSNMIDCIVKDYYLKELLPKILGNSGKYIYDLALAEIDLEQGNLKNAIMRANSLLYYYNDKLSVDVWSVGTNILVRAYIIQGKFEEAYKVLINLKKLIIQSNKLYLLPNYRTVSMKYYMANKNKALVSDWLSEHTYKNIDDIYFDEYYLYKNKARILLLKNDNYEALKLIEGLISKGIMYNRYIDLAELYYMKAIIYNNSDKSIMLDYIKKSLDITMPLKYKTIYYEYDIQGINTLDACYKMIDGNYYNYIKELLRNKSNYIHETFEIESDLDVKKLSKQEKLILTLLEKGYSNDEICKEIDIKLSTVKTYIARIFTKLGVKNRNQAVKIAKEIDIL